MRKNRTLAEFETLTQGARILEKESAGVKVLQLPDKRIIKLFRRKRLISSQIWAPHAWRFDRNARILKERGIRTINVESHFEIPEMKRQAVIYHRLEGLTLRDWIVDKDPSECAHMNTKLGAFIAKIHEAGVLFRSLHFGNVLVMEDDQLALIDIVDMSFSWFGPLTVNQRVRNFHHMDRYDDDRKALASEHGGGFIKHYLDASSLADNKKQILLRTFNEIFDQYRTKADA